MGQATDHDSLHLQVEQHPQDPERWVELGDALVEICCADSANVETDLVTRMSAQSALMHAFDLEPDDAAQCVVIGEGLLRLQQPQLAQLAFVRAVSLDKTSIVAHEGMTRIQLDTNPESALTILRGAISHAKPRSTTYLLMAEALRLLDRPDDSIRAVGRAVGCDPVDSQAWWFKARILGESGHQAECIAAWKDVVEHAPDDPQAATAYGAALGANQDYDMAVRVLGQVVTDCPESPEALLNLSLALCDRGDFDSAITTIREAITLDSRSAEAHHRLGQAEEKAGHKEQAIMAYERAIELCTDGKNVDAYHSLGALLRDMGRIQEARTALLRGAAQDPEHTGIQRELASALLSDQPAHGAAFAGSIVDFSVIESLEFLRNQRATGVLHVDNGEAVGDIVIDRGFLVAAASSSTRSILDTLLADDALNARQSSDIAQIGQEFVGASDEKKLTEALIGRKVVRQEHIEKAVLDQLRRATAEMIDWTTGKFSFRKGETGAPRVAEVRVDPAGLMLDLVRIKDEMNRVP